MTSRFSAVFEQRGEWWIGCVEEIPGANSQGRTLEETRENLREAVQLTIEANRQIARDEMKGKIDDRLAAKICKDLGVSRPEHS